MVHVVFDTSQLGYDDYVQTGAGPLGMSSGSSDAHAYTYFKGAPPYQRGYGLQGGAGVGDVFRGLWRFFLPLIKRVGTTVGSEALNTGQRVLERVTEGEPLKRAFVEEGKRGIDTVLEKGGMQKQFGTGKTNAIKRGRQLRKRLPPHQTIIGKAITIKKPGIISSKKRLRSDAFGLY